MKTRSAPYWKSWEVMSKCKVRLLKSGNCWSWPNSPCGANECTFAVQIRQLRKNHPDSKCVMVLLKYAKEFAVNFSQHVMLACVDDKAIVPVGEPSAAVSTGVRGHHGSLVRSSSLGALDNDFHTHGVVPSVSLLINIPESPIDSFFTGQVYVGNKNKVTQPSQSCLRS